MAITPLPTPPSRDDPANFATEADAFLGALPDFATEANALASAVNADEIAAAASASAASGSATAAAASATAAANASNATVWVSGTTYAIGDVRYSPIDFQAYRRKTSGAGATDPSSDSTNWELISGNVTTTAQQTFTNKTISADSNTLSGLAASSFVLSDASGNINGAAAQKAIPSGVVVGDTDTQTLTNKTLQAPNITSGLTLNGAAGTSGQVLTSAGSGSLPTWATVSAGFTLATPLATTSGTSVEFTGIPSGIKMLVINFHNVSTTNTAAQTTIQLGDSSGYPSTSAYYGVTIAWDESSNTRRNWNSYYPVLIQSTSQVYNYSGSIILSLMNSTDYIWSMQGLLHSSTISNVLAGSVDLAGSLSKLKLTTNYAFDNGSVNIMYM